MLPSDLQLLNADHTSHDLRAASKVLVNINVVYP